MRREAIRPDAQPFDQIIIDIVPRYKTSGLSGDEWRISTRTRFFRKGQQVHETEHGGRIEVAAAMLYADLAFAQDNGLAYFAGDGIHCDQEGCNEPWTVKYRRRHAFCDGGHPHPVSDNFLFRHFCEEHKTRGGCGLDDADRNYEHVTDAAPRHP